MRGKLSIQWALHKGHMCPNRNGVNTGGARTHGTADHCSTGSHSCRRESIAQAPEYYGCALLSGPITAAWRESLFAPFTPQHATLITAVHQQREVHCRWTTGDLSRHWRLPRTNMTVLQTSRSLRTLLLSKTWRPCTDESGVVRLKSVRVKTQKEFKQ